MNPYTKEEVDRINRFFDEAAIDEKDELESEEYDPRYYDPCYGELDENLEG